MTPDEILAIEPKVVTQQQRESYFENGYLLLERAVPKEWIDRLISVTNEMVDKTRSMAASDAIFDLEPGHTPDAPRCRRLSSPVQHHPAYWEFASQSVIADVAADLLGPNVKFHHSKLNFKWAQGGEEVKWHQDISYWPHTDYSPLTIGTYLYDVGDEQGPLGAVPGTHKGELFSQYGKNGQWVGCLAEEDLGGVDLGAVKYLTGPAGSITIHNCRVIHGSLKNLSDAGRPLLLNAYSAAESFPYTANPLPSRYAGTVVRGDAARWATHDPRPCEVPPDWSGGYTSLYAMQQEEEWDENQLDAVEKQFKDIHDDRPEADPHAISAE
jgi:ectoine hydroxylase-related dioxygenase (phytanoyl-CoA dioxygenase family)